MRLLRALLVLGVVIGSVAAGFAADVDVEFVDITDFPRTTITFTPPDGLSDDELAADALTITQNGDPVEITNLRPLDAEPVEAVLVIDTSGSMAGNPLASAKTAAIEFVRLMPEGSDIGLIAFGTNADVIAGFGTPLDSIEGSIRSLVTTGDTSLYDGVIEAVSMLEEGPLTRQFLILLTDGADTASVAGLDDVTTILGETEIGFYAVALAGTGFDTAAVEEMAVAADGILTTTPSSSELTTVYSGIASTLVSQYAVEFEAIHGGDSTFVLSVETAAGVSTSQFEVDLPSLGSSIPGQSRDPLTGTTVAPPEISVDVTPVVSPPPTRIVAEPGFTAESWAKTVGIAALGVTFFLALTLLFWPAQDTLPRRRGVVDVGASYDSGPMARLRGRLGGIAERFGESEGRRYRGMNTALDAAGVALKPGEFTLLTLGALVVALLIGVAVGNLPLLIILGGSAVLGPRLWIQSMVSRRRADFADQLEGTLQLIAGSLRAGYGVSHAINAVATEADEPTRSEFARVVVETRLGRDLDDSLEAMAERMDNEDLSWVTDAIEIQRSVGGNLAEILDRVSDTIRERNQIKRQVRALSAEGRLSAVILIALPFFFVAFLSVRNPDYLAELTGSTAGQIMAVSGVVLMVIGVIWIRNLIRIKY